MFQQRYRKKKKYPKRVPTMVHRYQPFHFPRQRRFKNESPDLSSASDWMAPPEALHEAVKKKEGTVRTHVPLSFGGFKGAAICGIWYLKSPIFLKARRFARELSTSRFHSMSVSFSFSSPARTGREGSWKRTSSREKPPASKASVSFRGH